MTEYSDTYLKQLVAITKEIVKEVKLLRREIQEMKNAPQLTQEEKNLAQDGIIIEEVYVESPIQRLEDHIGEF